MPSNRQLLFALFEFGAADPKEKARVIEHYLEECKGPNGQPHVWSPTYEIVESLSILPTAFAGSEKERVICVEVETLAERLLTEEFSAIEDPLAFSSKTSAELQSKCREGLTILGIQDEPPLSFFVLMSHTCD